MNSHAKAAIIPNARELISYPFAEFGSLVDKQPPNKENSRQSEHKLKYQYGLSLLNIIKPLLVAV